MPSVLNKANQISWFSFNSEHTKTFHMSWIAFFMCFLAWFGIAHLMVVIRDELKLTSDQVTYTIIASISGTVISRVIVGWLCDYIGPRKVFSALLVFSSIPIFSVIFIHDFFSLLIVRLFIGCIGFIGASFVINQYHISRIIQSNNTICSWKIYVSNGHSIWNTHEERFFCDVASRRAAATDRKCC